VAKPAGSQNVTLRNLLHRARQIDSWLIAPALLVVIFGELTHLSAVFVVESYVWDKVLHFTAYFGLCLMTTIAVRANRNALWWALGLVLLGGSLEIIQRLTGRDADIFDELANTLGVLAGLGFGWLGVAILRARKLVGDGRPD
jgi:VanZ family protein